MPIGRGGGAEYVEGSEGDGFAAGESSATVETPVTEVEALENAPQVTTLSDGWALGS